MQEPCLPNDPEMVNRWKKGISELHPWKNDPEGSLQKLQRDYEILYLGYLNFRKYLYVLSHDTKVCPGDSIIAKTINEPDQFGIMPMEAVDLDCTSKFFDTLQTELDVVWHDSDALTKNEEDD